MSDLSWDSPYAVARALQAHYPQVDLEDVSLQMIYRWTLALPDFEDDPDMATDEILMAIFQEWFEETG